MPTEETKNDRRSIDQEIGARVRATREVLGVSQQALAEKLGVTYQQIQKYEQGINRISTATLIRLCQSLNISPMEIIGMYFPLERPSGDRMDRLQEKLLTAERKLAGVRRALRDE
ncbi:Antitoxin PezA [Ensifer psoraleae]|uniref:helix-turn-helix domain-containing protein n=1 Tax=Sinorhizobium TaxID=28105 RepID=UPI0015692DE6|nr:MULTISPECIES: helix-turn-helix transcriptional regulator [Sinorhizobium]MDK1389727.1 helix-turn-helix transcriptional regulator [Sinorhizobium sp. 7-81]NRP74539.1 Antitoxin PezA [Sinorhizobium psoraleae]